jgi:hemolysin III
VSITAEQLLEHYPNRAEKLADLWIHAIGIAAALIGGGVLIDRAMSTGGGGLTLATGLYALCLIAMLASSAAFNLSRPCAARSLLRRLDYAGIFLMIAGSYTPFTSQGFAGGSAAATTALVWMVALGGAAGNLLAKKPPGSLWTLIYMGFGGLALSMVRPLIADLPRSAFVLLVTGGLIYAAGTLVLHSRLPYRRAIWHGFVIAAAGLHYGAVFSGVVLAGRA